MQKTSILRTEQFCSPCLYGFTLIKNRIKYVSFAISPRISSICLGKYTTWKYIPIVVHEDFEM
jgi:hypothetical protein